MDGEQPVGIVTDRDLVIRGLPTNLASDLGELVRPITGQVIFGAPEGDAGLTTAQA